MADGSYSQVGTKRTERPDLIQDDEKQKKLLVLMEEFLTRAHAMEKKLGGDIVLAWEWINEPEFAAGVPFPVLKTFVNKGNALIHKTIPGSKVRLGSRSVNDLVWWLNEESSRHIDEFWPHFYNHHTHGVDGIFLDELKTGTLNVNGKPVGIGETEPLDEGGKIDVRNKMTECYRNGASGVMFWCWTSVAEGRFRMQGANLNAYAQWMSDNGKEPGIIPHPFNVLSGMRACFLTGGLSFLGIFGSLIQYFTQGDFTGLTLAAILAGLYFGWASIRFLLVSSVIFETLKSHYRQHPDIEKFPETNGIPTAVQTLLLSIAESSGYRHPAFYSLPVVVRRVINIHEFYESHLKGMFAMLPLAGVFTEKHRPHAPPAGETAASFENIYSLYEIDFARQHAKRVEKIAALLADKMGLSGRMINKIRFTAAVHDIGTYREPIDRETREEARRSLAKKGIPVPEKISWDIEWYNQLVRTFGMRKGEFTPIEIASAFDFFQGPASLRAVRENNILLLRGQRTAVLFHHNIGELEGYLARQDWPEDEKEETRLIASVLVAADSIETGMNLFKQIFFFNRFEVETSGQTRKFLRTRSGIPEAYLSRILPAFEEINILEKYRSIARDAAIVSGAERRYLHRIGRGIGPAAWFEHIFRRILTRLKKHGKGNVVIRYDQLVTLLGREFPEGVIDKSEFVTQFRDGLPPRMLKDREYTAFLVKTAYKKALDVLEDPEKLHFDFCYGPGFDYDQLIMAFADVRRGISKFILNTIVSPGVNVEKEGTFYVEVPYDDSMLRICIDIKDITAEGKKLNEATKRKISAVLSDTREFSVRSIIEYRGISSIKNAMVRGSAAYYDAGEGIDIAAILHNIITPVEAQYDAGLAAELVEKEINDFLVTINRIQRETGLEKDILEELLALVEEVKEELRGGIVRGKRILKPKAVVLLYRKIAARISGLKEEIEKMQEEKASPITILPLELRACVLERLDKTRIEDVFHGRIREGDV
ncbi:MAG: hypothetical protein DRP85_08950, partial [Candidatus Makaraimicrobium thalassicum]